jgi:hypothetical protein
MHAFVATILKAAGRRRMTLKNARICGHLLNQILARLQTISQTNYFPDKLFPRQTGCQTNWMLQKSVDD